MQEGWKFWVDVVIAIGTLAAVVVALFGEWLRARMFTPKLTLTLASPRGDPTPVTVPAPNGTSRVEQARYYRLRVSNQVPWPKATQLGFNSFVSRSLGPMAGYN